MPNYNIDIKNKSIVKPKDCGCNKGKPVKQTSPISPISSTKPIVKPKPKPKSKSNKRSNNKKK